MSRTNTGRSTVETWQGTETDVNEKIATLAAWNVWDIDDSESPKYSLNVRSPDLLDGNSSAEVSWEIAGGDQQKEMRQHPSILWASSGNEGQRVLREIMRFAEDKSLGPPVIPNVTLPTAKTDVLYKLYDLLMEGHTHWLWPSYTLRFTAVVGPNFTGGIVDDGAMRVWSASRILSDFSGFPPYARIANRITYLQAQNPYMLFDVEDEQILQYVWGWLKKPMTETQLPDFKIKLQTEWNLDFWETFMTYRVLG